MHKPSLPDPYRTRIALGTGAGAGLCLLVALLRSDPGEIGRAHV